MRNKIAILSMTPGWMLYLRQEGLSYEHLRSHDDLNSDRFSVVVVNASLDQRTYDVIRRFLSDGGAVLDCGPYADYAGIHRDRRRVHVLSSDPADPDFSNVWLCDVDTPLNLGESFGHMGGAVGFVEAGNGLVGMLPCDPGPLFVGTSSARRSFYAPFARYPTEVVARQSKNEWRKLVTDTLRQLHFRRGLPFAQVSYFPGTATNLFLYRIDSDYGEASQIDRLYQLAEKHQIRMTWFLHVAAHDSWLSRFHASSCHEIAVHSYDHTLLSSYELARYQIDRACRRLHDAGFQPAGFAAPFGIWNEPLARAAEEVGFVYASEFAFDYDNLPSYPWLQDRFSSVLQVPIHPVCIGNLRRLKVKSDDMMAYFRFVIEKKISHDEPVALYHHPTHEEWEVVDDLLSCVTGKRLPSWTFLEYADWWKRRLEIAFDIYLQANELRLTSDQSTDIRVRLTDNTGKWALLELNRVYRMDDIVWSDVAPAMAPPSSIADIRRFRLRDWMHRIEDFKNRFPQ